MGIAVTILGCIYIIVGCLALIPVVRGGELTDQQRDQLQLTGISLALVGLGFAILLSSRDRR